MGKWILNVLIGIDQLVNAILLGDPDETLSSRFGKWLKMPHHTWRWKVAYLICRILHIFDKGHCEKSIEYDEGGNALTRKPKK